MLLAIRGGSESEGTPQGFLEHSHRACCLSLHSKLRQAQPERLEMTHPQVAPLEDEVGRRYCEPLARADSGLGREAGGGVQHSRGACWWLSCDSPRPASSDHLSRLCMLARKLPQPPETAPPAGDHAQLRVWFTLKPQQGWGESMVYFPTGFWQGMLEGDNVIKD